MGYYKDICDRLIDDAKRITEGHGFFTEYRIVIEEADGERSVKLLSERVEPDFFDAVSKVARKLRELLNDKETKKTEQSFGIKGEREKASLNLYKHYNRLTALEDIDYETSASMKFLIDAIEKLEHARHMEASDEIAKMSIEKLDKLAAPIPEIRMSGIPKEYREVLDKCKKKEGAKNDD